MRLVTRILYWYASRITDQARHGRARRSGAGHGAPASDGVGESEGRSPSDLVSGEPDSARGGSMLGRCHVGMFAGLGKADWLGRFCGPANTNRGSAPEFADDVHVPADQVGSFLHAHQPEARAVPARSVEVESGAIISDG